MRCQKTSFVRRLSCLTWNSQGRVRIFHPFYLFASLLFLVPCLPGCVSTSPDERIQQFNEDGVFLYQKGDYARARENFELALSLQPENPGLLYNVGQCYEQQGNVKKAEELYRLCLSKKAEHNEGQEALAKLLLKQGRKNEARDIGHTWLVSQPKVAEAYAQDAWRLQQEGDLLSAIGRAQQALEINPNNVAALTQLGLLYEAQERPDRALVLYQKALDRDPHREDIRDRINTLLAKGVRPPLPDS